MDINYINELKIQGLTTKEIAEKFNISDRTFQKKIKDLGYIYNQKLKQYIKRDTTIIGGIDSTIEVISQDEVIKSDDVVYHTISQQSHRENIIALSEHTEDILKMLEVFKQNQTVIHCDTIDTSILEGGTTQTSIRVNKNVLTDFRIYTEKSKYSSSELISIALLEFMNNHKL